MTSKFIHTKFYEKFYGSLLIEYYPVIRTINVSQGKLTDMFLHITYSDFYLSEPQSFIDAICYTLKSMNDYLGNDFPSLTVRLDRGKEFMVGKFVEG